MEVGPGKKGSRVIMWSHWRPQPSPWAALQLGWTFGVTLSWGQGAARVHPCIDQALNAATGKGDMTLGEVAAFG